MGRKGSSSRARAWLLNRMGHMSAEYDQDRRHVGQAQSSGTRGHSRLLWDAVFTGVRLIRKRVENAYVVFGIFLLSGAAIAIGCTWAFAELAGHVRSGTTQAFDDAVMRWIANHQNPTVQKIMLELTSLGTGTVVAMIV